MNRTIERLFVLWREPKHGQRHVIGELWREPPGTSDFCFAYADDLTSAMELGFSPLTEFPDTHRTLANPYRSRYLFPTFAQRIPSPKRPDREEILRSWGLGISEKNVMRILARSGGIQVTDRLELADHLHLGQ